MQKDMAKAINFTALILLLDGILDKRIHLFAPKKKLFVMTNGSKLSCQLINFSKTNQKRVI